MNISLRSIVLIAILGIAISGCKKPVDEPTPEREFHFMFENYFGDKELELNNTTYTTAQNEQITVTTFNYWITNIKLIKSDGTMYTEPESYRLMRADKGSSLHFHMADVPDATYRGVEFMIGVDVPRNTSGAQEGALDPAVNGDMYWDWNSGYIQAKLEGTSPQSTESNNMFRYHIGGVAAGIETPQKLTISFPNEVVVGEQNGSIKIKTDVAKWFPTPMPIAMMPTMMHSNEMAKKIAEGYADMFSVMSAGNE